MFIIENLRRLRAMEAIFYETVLICWKIQDYIKLPEGFFSTV